MTPTPTTTPAPTTTIAQVEVHIDPESRARLERERADLRASFERFIEQYHSRFIGYAAMLTQYRDHADDVVAQAEFKLWRLWPNMQDHSEGERYAYAKRTVHSEAIDHLRHVRLDATRRGISLDGLVRAEDGHDAPAIAVPVEDGTLECLIVREEVSAALAAITPRQRPIVRLVIALRMMGYNYAEMADLMTRHGMPTSESALKTSWHRFATRAHSARESAPATQQRREEQRREEQSA